ncbi:MAG: LysR family transcriptional regulator [Planctomycetota bacterium]
MPDKRRYYKELRISQLRAILHLARSGGFASTAAHLELSTPTVWNQIRALESEFELKLVEVTGRSVVLTDHGRRLVDLATPIVDGFDSLAKRFAEETGRASRHLSIASPSNILINEIPWPFRVYRGRYPEVELSLVDLPSIQAKQAVQEGDVDLAIAGLIDDSLPKGLGADSVAEFPFVLACQREHPLLSMNRITAKSLVKYPLILSAEGTNTRTRIDSVLRNAGVHEKANLVCEASTKDLCLQYVDLGFGITIAPLSPTYQQRIASQTPSLNNLVFRDLSKTFGTEPIVVMYRHDRYEPEHQKAFRSLVCSQDARHQDAE